MAIFRTIMVFLGLALIATAQTSDLDALAAVYPQCSLDCMIEFIPQSACLTQDGLNQTCVCVDEVLTQKVAACAVQTCTVKEMLTTQNATSVACGRPIPDHSTDMMIIGFTVGGVAFITFVVRIATRMSTQARRLYEDDYVMFAAVLVMTPPTVFAYNLATNGLGRDIWTLPFGNVTAVLEFFFLGELFYFLGISLVKISILLFFYRVFPVKVLQTIFIILMFIIGGYGIAFFFATLFQCRPINYMWEQWHGELPGECNEFHLQGFISAGINIFLDIIVITLPLKPLYELNLSLRKRISIMLMFLVGGFATVVAIVRLKYLVQFRHTTNPTYDYYAPGYWSLVEGQVSVICANMPAIYQLIKAWRPKLVSGTTQGKSSRSRGPSTGVSAPTPEPKVNLGSGKFSVSSGPPRIRTMQHERSESTEYLRWGKEPGSNAIELCQTNSTASPPREQYYPGQAV